jgi:glucose/mannose transport system permease protein
MRNPLSVLTDRLADRRGDGLRTDGGQADATESFFERESVRSAPFWLPPALLVGLFVYGAIGWNVLLSLTDFTGLGSPDYGSLDFENYVVAFQGGTPSWADLSVDPIWNAFGNTVVLILAFASVCLALGIVLAILVDQEIRFENTFRTIYLLPMSLSFVVTAQFWLWIYNYNNGIANSVIGTVGLGPVSWLGNQDIVLYAVIFALMWQFSGYAMVVYLAGLRAIPREHYEAAQVDGASTLKMYWRVIIPQLKGATISAAVVLMVFGMKAFDFLYSLTGGYRPPNGADILATKMVREAYANLNWAYGSAIAIVLFGMALGVIGPYLVYEYRRDNL